MTLVNPTNISFKKGAGGGDRRSAAEVTLVNPTNISFKKERAVGIEPTNISLEG